MLCIARASVPLFLRFLVGVFNVVVPAGVEQNLAVIEIVLDRSS